MTESVSVLLYCIGLLVNPSTTTHYINYTFIMSLYTVKRVPVSIFFKSCFWSTVKYIFPLISSLIFVKACPCQDHKNVRGIMFKYLIAPLLSSIPKIILFIFLIFFMCVCVYKCFIERAAESEGCRRGVGWICLRRKENSSRRKMYIHRKGVEELNHAFSVSKWILTEWNKY